MLRACQVETMRVVISNLAKHTTKVISEDWNTVTQEPQKAQHSNDPQQFKEDQTVITQT